MNNLIVPLFKHNSTVYNTVVRKQSEKAMGAVPFGGMDYRTQQQQQ
jgi:hypothetical protein